MANVILMWGKCSVTAIPLDAQGQEGTPYVFPVPVDGTTTLATAAGDTLEAKIEGGEIIARLQKASSYTLEFEIHIAAGYPRPAAPYDGSNGVIFGEYQIKVQSADPNAVHLQFNRCTMSVAMTFSTTDGIRWKYTVSILKPTAGETYELVDP